MPEQNEDRKSLMQVIRFTFFSISAGLIEVLADALLNELCGLDPTVSYVIALILSVLWNYTFNRRYTFRSADDIRRSMLLVALFYVVFTPVSGWWTDALVKGCGWNPYVVLALTMGINFITEFLFQRFVVFRDTIDTNDVARRERAREGRG